ncbi:TerC family protein [Falsiroseomonas oryzae]|uniref:TerC family protein n=1 Tax=Falsiroseomonas oryzae TaxID=2766473 RepID=UPI002FDC27EE
MDFSSFGPQLEALFTVLFIDIVLAGDNAVVVGMAAAGLPADQRRKAIFWGIAAATIMRIGFASITIQLLQVVGLVFVGGLLLLWVCWKMYRELRDGGNHSADHVEQDEGVEALEGHETPGVPRKTLRQAITQILVADISMSLDNVLAVAGAAKDHPYIMAFGLIFSVVLMGVAATFIAKLLEKHRWIGWLGLFLILYVAVQMIYEGTFDIANNVPHAYGYLFLPLGWMAIPGGAATFPIGLWFFATVFQVVFLVAVATVVADLTLQLLRRRAR